jgi:hypothetical protein
MRQMRYGDDDSFDDALMGIGPLADSYAGGESIPLTTHTARELLGYVPAVDPWFRQQQYAAGVAVGHALCEPVKGDAYERELAIAHAIEHGRGNYEPKCPACAEDQAQAAEYARDAREGR